MARHLVECLFVIVLTCLVNTGLSQTFNGQGGLLVPPGAPAATVGITTSIATVSGIGILGSGCSIIDNVTLNFTHTFVGDVAIFIIAPGGQVLELSSSNGGSGDNYQVTVFKDNTPAFITSGAPPYNGTFRPEGRQTNTSPPFPNGNPLGTNTFASTFSGINADGNWTMFINDYVAIDVGVLNAWSITFSVGGGPAPTVTLGPDITICPGQSTLLTASVSPSAGSYLWSTGAITPTINVSPASTTTYSVTVTNNGCTDADTIQVFVNPGGVLANAGPDINLCTGMATTLTGSGGGPGASYNWSTGQSGNTIIVNPLNTTTYTLTVTDGGCTGTDQVVVTVNPVPLANAGLPVAICMGQTATLTASGGSLNNHYLWSTGQTGPTIIVNPIVTTTYTVTVTVNGCSESDDVEVTVNPVPTVDAGPNIQICAGESADLSATGSGSTYIWSTGQTGPDITVSPVVTTTYIVTASDNGCTATDNVTVTVGNIIAGVTPDQAICEGNTITLTATGGSAYDWSTGQSGASISVSPGSTTTYTVTATQGNCSDEASVVITVNPVPVVTVSPDDEICAGEFITLTASGGNSYSWSSGQNTNVINVSPGSSTDYTVTVTSNGCSSSASVFVTVNPVPNASAGPDESICEGDAVTLTASGLTGPGTYEWNTGATGPSITVSPATTTTYIVTITNQWDCFDVDNVTVVVNPIPVANAGPDKDLCDGNSTTLVATGGIGASSYHWSTGQTGSSITVSPVLNTTYLVTVTVAGCSSEDEVDVNVFPSPVAFAGSDQQICEGNSVELTATGGGSYQWSTGQLTATIDVAPAATTTYNVIVTAGNGCTDQDNVTIIVFPTPAANAGPDQSICEGSGTTLAGSGGANYAWSTGETTQTIDVLPLTTTTYQLTVTDFNGCSDTDVVSVMVNSIPVANAGTNVFILPGGSATLNATGGGSYVWNTGETTTQITVMPAVTTVYSVTVTINGCSDVDEVTVFVNEAPSVDLGPDLVICQGETATIDASITGPFTLQYMWSTGETSNLINVTPPATTSYSVTATDIVSGFFSVDTMTVTVLTLPMGIPVINGSLVLCEGDVVTYTTNTIQGATTYTWSLPAGAIIIAGQGTTSVDVDWGSLTGGPVQLVVANSCGSLPAILVDVTVNKAPIFTGPVNGQADPCADGSGTYSIPGVSGADTYLWTLTGGGTIISGQGTTTPTIEWNGSTGGDLCIVASNGCGSSVPVCLPVITTISPVLNAGSDQTDCGLISTLNATGVGVWSVISGPGSVQFSDVNDPSSTIQASLPGVYTLHYSFSQNGCLSEDEMMLTFNETPAIINEVNDCNSINTAYTVSFGISSGLAPYTINGNSFGGGVFTSVPIASGDPYSFQVTDANGCNSPVLSGQLLCLCTSQSGSMDLTPIEVCVNATASAFYNGGSVLDGNDKLAFILHDGNIPGGIIAWSVNPEFQFMPPMQTETTYFIAAVIGDEGPDGFPLLVDPCLAISPGTPVKFHDLPLANAGTDKILGCNPDVVLLDAGASSAGPDIIYAWSTIGGAINGPFDTIQINAAASGRYILTVTNILGGCSALDTVVVIANKVPIDNLEISTIPPLCTDDCNGIIQIDNSSLDLLIDFGDGNFTANTTFNSACSGLLTIAVMDTLGCVADTAVQVDNPLPVEVALGPDQLIPLGDSVTLTAQSISNILQFNWFSASGCTTCPQITVIPSETSIYIVEVTDMNQCTARDEVVISVVFSNEVFIPHIFSPNGDQINDIFIIDGGPNLSVIDDLEIFDRWGNQVYEQKNITPGDISRGWDGKFNGSPVNPGVYVYKTEVTFLDGKTILLSGDVTVIK